MVKLWEYEYAGKIKVTTTDNRVFTGEAGDFTDAEELEGAEEDNLTVWIDGVPTGFNASEVAEISVLGKK